MIQWECKCRYFTSTAVLNQSNTVGVGQLPLGDTFCISCGVIDRLSCPASLWIPKREHYETVLLHQAKGGEGLLIVKFEVTLSNWKICCQ